MTKISKTPPIDNQTKLLCFDLEANGLHGQVFAVGAVVMDSTGKILDQFSGRCKLNEEIDEWVAQNILPAIKDMSATHGNPEALREAFWRWYLQAEPQSDYVLVNNGYPVEYRFLMQCQEADLNERYWQHPFPILDLSSLLVQAHQDKKTIRKEILSKFSDQLGGSAHNPLYDAKLSALMAFSVLLPSE